jgi:hypothetical protein
VEKFGQIKTSSKRRKVMDINATKSAASLPFRGRTNNEEKRSNSLPFVATSAAIGAGIGLLTPERKVFKTAEEVTAEHLSEVLKNAAEHTKNFTVGAAEKFKNAVKTAYSEINGFATKPVPPKADNNIFSEANVENLQEKHFKELKKLAPTEPVIHSTARGAAIGGGIALGLVVTSKLLDQLSPPKDIYTDYSGNVLASQQIKSYES